MSVDFDVFIPVAPKDRDRLRHTIRSIWEHVPGAREVHIFEDRNKAPFDFDRARMNFRPGWIFQQFIKMFQVVTGDLYLTVDADVIFNRRTPFFTDDGKRIIYRGWDQNYRPYFEFQEKMFGLPREFPGTFINDMNFFDRKIIHEMMERSGYTVQSFVDKCYDVINAECVPAEPEIYGQYVFKHHMDKYEFRQAKTKSWGRVVKSRDENAWPDADIEKMIEDMKGEDVDMFMLHNWFNE